MEVILSQQKNADCQITVHYEGTVVKCDPDKSVLDNLLDQSLAVNHSCKKGVCLTCLLKTDDKVDVKSRAPLKATLIEQGYFLSCQQVPIEGMMIKSAQSTDFFQQALVSNRIEKSGYVSQIFLKPYGDFSYKPGQFINIKGPNDIVRSYSIASIPSDNVIEIHVKEHQYGVVSRWLCSDKIIGQEIEISAANGECFYLPDNQDQPMLMIGTGTGLAPLLGILRDSQSQNHRGKIELYFGAVDEAGLYLADQLRDLEAEYIHLTVHFGTLKEGPINDMALKNHPNLKGWRVFLCGDPEMVKKTKTKAYLADAALSDIYADAFDLAEISS